MTAQEILPDTIMLLDTVSISAERYIEFSAGQKIDKLNQGILEENKRNNIGNTLSENSAVYIRSYGQNTLTSMSIRGTSSSQSSIFWNGINVRMPSLGSTDLSMIPSSFFNSAAIVYGGNSIRYGSGTIGGAVFLNNMADFRKSISAGIELGGGSFGSLWTHISTAISNDRYYLKLGFGAQQAENDFKFTDTRGESKELQNAANSGLGFNLHAAARVGKSSQADLYLWYQEALREIPPTTTMNSSDAYQSDRALRTSLQWKSTFKTGALNIKTAWFNEFENYSDPQISLQSTIKTNTGFFEAEYKQQLFVNAIMDAGISYTIEQADIEAYGGIKDRDYFAAFINYKQHLPQIDWDFVIGARQEFNGDGLSPFSPSLGLEGPIIQFLSNKFSVSRNFRLPTMNELYWQPGGNPDIQPEKSWNIEYSLIAEAFRRKENVKLQLSVTAYSSMVDDWIQWLPASNNIWAVDNVKKVWARGFESSLDFIRVLGNKSFDLGVHYTYSKSTNKDDTEIETEGKQLIYIPLHNASGRLGFSLKKWRMDLFGRYTGESFTSSDNLKSIPGYFLMDLALKKQFDTKMIGIAVSARLKNIFDKQYQVVAYRPMPGINFQFSVSLTFNK